MPSTLDSIKIQNLLTWLYEDAARPAPADGPTEVADERERFHSLRHAYLAIGPEFGRLIYNLACARGARHIVEFGTSMGVSSIYLAAALQDNGGGTLITTEYEPEKVQRARQNLTKAGLVDLVDFRLGDALQTLAANLPDKIDMLFLDGAKGMYLDVLKLVEPRLAGGAIIASDNTDMEGTQSFLDYVRKPGSGYVSSAIATVLGDRHSGHEITLRI